MNTLESMSQFMKRHSSPEMKKTLITKENLQAVFDRLYNKHQITLVFPEDTESNFVNIYYGLGGKNDKETYHYDKKVPFFFSIYLEDFEEQIEENILPELVTINYLRDKKLIQKLEMFVLKIDSGFTSGDKK